MITATEKDYDDIIAPMLLEVAQKAEALGFSFIARVEWDEGSGITQMGPMTSSGQMLTQYAAHSRGNVDLMLTSLAKAGVDCSTSVFLSQFFGGTAMKDEIEFKLVGPRSRLHSYKLRTDIRHDGAYMWPRHTPNGILVHISADDIVTRSADDLDELVKERIEEELAEERRPLGSDW